MRTLSNNENQAISAGQFNISVRAIVPDDLKDWTEDTIDKIKTGIIKDPFTFLQHLRNSNGLGVNFSEIKIEEISYYNL